MLVRAVRIEPRTDHQWGRPVSIGLGSIVAQPVFEKETQNNLKIINANDYDVVAEAEAILANANLATV